MDGWDLGVLLARSGDREALENILLGWSDYSAAQDYINLTDTIGSIFLEGAPPYRRPKFHEWWNSRKDRIRWDPDRRKFMVTNEPGTP